MMLLTGKTIDNSARLLSTTMIDYFLSQSLLICNSKVRTVVYALLRGGNHARRVWPQAAAAVLRTYYSSITVRCGHLPASPQHCACMLAVVYVRLYAQISIVRLSLDGKK